MIYPRQLTIQLRRRQLQDIYGNNIEYTGPNPLLLHPTAATSSTTWIDFTDFVQGLDKCELSWSTTQTPAGTVSEGQLVPKIGVSGTLTFERDAYDFLKRILVENVAAPLNQVEARITDIASGSYEGYVIKASQLSWCEFNALCTYELNLKQQDYYTQCIEKTLIADNWQGWFQSQPAEIAPGVGKKHPRFSYCTEHRPNGTLVMEWYLLGILSMFSFIFVAIIAVFDVFALVINGIISVINIILTLLSSLITIAPFSFIPIVNPTSIFDKIAQLYIEAAGCGREHPAPLIRDYITNVCNRCRVTVNANTADIFFAPIITIQKSDGNVYTEPNPHYNACLFFPNVKRGIRRFASINLFGDSEMDSTTYYDTNNSPLWALSDMLDHLKGEYNAQWQVKEGPGAIAGTIEYYLYFKRKDFFANQPPLYDFSIGGADRGKLVEGICYQPQDYTIPASMTGLYRDDPADKCGHENGRNMNGDPVSFNNTTVNPLFHGVLDKRSAFAATKFRLDGSTSDYIYDAGQVVAKMPASSLFPPFYISQIVTLNKVFDFVRMYGDYAVLLQGETVTVPKILIWDGKNNGGYGSESNAFLNARAIRDTMFIGASETSVGAEYTLGKTAHPGTVTGITMPDVNPVYPAQVSSVPAVVPPPFVPSTVPELLLWNDGRAYPANTNVIGYSLGFIPAVPGKYTIIDWFGINVSQNAAILVNYPLFFNPYYRDSMWDWFHWIDDPYRLPRLRKEWHLKIPLCDEDLNKLGLIGDGMNAKLLQSVLLDATFYNQGVITDINVGYDTGNELGTGQYIQLKGYV